MCLYLVGSKFRNVAEVEYLLNNGVSEATILEIQNNRKEIQKQKQMAYSRQYIDELGI